MKSKSQQIRYAVILVCTVLLSSCIQSINREMLAQAHDETAPLISSVTPDNGYAYGAYTQVCGTVTDLDSDGEPGKVEYLTLEIVGISDAIFLDVDSEGRFDSGLLETFGPAFVGPINIRITALDWKGNSSEYNLNYSRADGEITNFKLVRGNKQAALTWDRIPEMEDYEVRELYYGLGTKKIHSEDSTISLVWDGLENGKNYSFVISTVPDSDEDPVFTSAISGIMPLSPLSCTPVVTVNKDSIDLLWPELPDGEKYVVRRSLHPEGPWETIGITPKNYLRINESSQTLYYYHVYPYSTEAPLEEEFIETLASTGMQTYYWQRIKAPELKGTQSSAGFNCITVQNDIAYLGTDSATLSIVDVSNPSAPFSRNSFTDTGGGNPVHLTVRGAYGFLSCTGSDLITLDLTDPVNPKKLGQLEFTGMYPVKSFLYGSVLYLILNDDTPTGNTALAIVDVSDPSDPVLMALNQNHSFSGLFSDMYFFRHYELKKNLVAVSQRDLVEFNGNINFYELTDTDIFNSEVTATQQAPLFGTTGTYFTKQISYSDSYLYCTISTTENGISEKFGAAPLSGSIPSYNLAIPQLIDDLNPGGAETHSLTGIGSVALYNFENGISSYSLWSSSEISANSSYYLNPMFTTTGLDVHGEYAYLSSNEGLEIFKLIPDPF